MSHLDGERLRRALVSACDYVQQRRAELNRINVFPVPDGDTGTNLALTAGAIAERLRPVREASVGAVARDAADAAILGARGNCGMILSHFLLGFSRDVGQRPRLSAPEFAGALSAAVRHVYRSLERPVEGTIVTVMREVAEEAEARRTDDFADLVESLLTRAQEALARTPELLPQLRAAGVVDAGAKGFVHMMEGVVAYVRGDPFVALEVLPQFAEAPAAAALAEYPVESERYRFCTEALVRGGAIPEADEVRAVLRERGDSLIVIRGDGVLKVHVHTDEPDGVFAYLRGLGELVTHKAEDMAAQHAAVERAASSHVQLARRPLSIVTDSACNLSSEIVRAHGIHVVPMYIVFGDEIVRDGVDLDAEAFTRRLRAGEHPTTSQPPPAAFLDAYRRASEDGETVLAITVASALSGTFRSAEAAGRQLPEVPLVLFDSRGASLTQGLLVLRAAELSELGMPVDAIVRELDRIRGRSGIFFTVDVFDHLLASGRVGRGKVMIAGLLDIKPILGLGEDGRVGPLANVRGGANVLPRMLDILASRIPREVRALRFGVVHVGCLDVAERVARELRRRFGERETLIAPASPVLATHLGPGAWGIAYQVED